MTGTHKRKNKEIEKRIEIERVREYIGSEKRSWGGAKRQHTRWEMDLSVCERRLV